FPSSEQPSIQSPISRHPIISPCQIRVLCGVDHDDLKQLFHVSKTIREATLIAKQWHFAYSTPAKTSAFRNSIDLEDTGDIEAPNAPKQFRK
ncbi:F-box protein SKIP27-like, partial [Diospyros lotus]|uniref:F-box protein SKIP27-like n=1 Tax=Diospyros lotus TaxID=55363 RepID=UPI00225817D6